MPANAKKDEGNPQVHVEVLCIAPLILFLVLWAKAAHQFPALLLMPGGVLVLITGAFIALSACEERGNRG